MACMLRGFPECTDEFAGALDLDSRDREVVETERLEGVEDIVFGEEASRGSGCFGRLPPVKKGCSRTIRIDAIR
jgi:hypothetical protein